MIRMWNSVILKSLTWIPPTTQKCVSIPKRMEFRWHTHTHTQTGGWERKKKAKLFYLLYLFILYFPVDTLAQKNQWNLSMCISILLCPVDCSHFASTTSAPVMYNKWIEVELSMDRQNISNTRISTYRYMRQWFNRIDSTDRTANIYKNGCKRYWLWTTKNGIFR